MDLDLLRSPQLYSLDYTLFGNTSHIFISEFSLLKQILLKSKNLRILRLGFQNVHLPFNNPSEVNKIHRNLLAGPLNLQFEPDDSCPPLQELKLPEQYHLEREHCLNWQVCMNWSHLTALDLGSRCPQNFLSALTGYVPNLKRLHLLLREGRDPEKQCSNMSIVRKFLNAIDGLEELYLQNCYEKFFEQVWPRLKRHCPTLRVLEVHTPRGFNHWPRWGILELEDLLNRAPKIQAISIDMGLMNEYEAIYDNNPLIWACDRFISSRLNAPTKVDDRKLILFY
jgi:hypothetical protein